MQAAVAVAVAVRDRHRRHRRRRHRRRRRRYSAFYPVALDCPRRASVFYGAFKSSILLDYCWSDSVARRVLRVLTVVVSSCRGCPLIKS